MKKIIVIAVLVIFSFTSIAQHCGSAAAAKCNTDPILEVKGATTIVIQTNAFSAKSNDIFKENLPFLKGIKDFKYDEKTYKVAVAYDPKKTSPETIREAISKLGFNADKVVANEQARAKLPAECKTMPKGCAASCGKQH